MPELLDLLTEPDQTVVTIITPGESETLDRDARFELACQLYPNDKVEMDEEGNIIVTPGNSEDSSFRSGEAFAQLAQWSKTDGTGRAFDATANFNLPSGAKRQPDAAWVPKEVLRREGKAKLRTITKTRHVPTFLIEVTSPSDTLKKQKEKCVKWMEAGVQEAWLLHPKTRTAFLYRAGANEPEEISEAKQIESQALAGFTFDCAPVWEDLTD